MLQHNLVEPIERIFIQSKRRFFALDILLHFQHFLQHPFLNVYVGRYIVLLHILHDDIHGFLAVISYPFPTFARSFGKLAAQFGILKGVGI